MGQDWLGFVPGAALGKPLTSAVAKVDWYLSLPPLRQCCGMNGSSMFSRGGLFQGYLGEVISQGGFSSVQREEQCRSSVSGPEQQLRGDGSGRSAGGFQRLCRAAGCGQEQFTVTFCRQHFLRQLHHYDRSGFQDSDRGDQRGESEAADLGHGRAGALPHHHLHVSQAGLLPFSPLATCIWISIGCPKSQRCHGVGSLLVEEEVTRWATCPRAPLAGGPGSGGCQDSTSQPARPLAFSSSGCKMGEQGCGSLGGHSVSEWLLFGWPCMLPSPTPTWEEASLF
ncbi:uncharacterized protein LOC115942994 [Leptonychotes weddellii]|uniref:Uncharacterized protein LOC115942994 n=1 Tax=Leptonychotes weddellii TaxID=9713 RepID=A0A7F8RBE3_LEPWE|nr:uncharacterized protein LOC115942994 [Leptonychotes weddellii]